jgi:hypothetical protein
MSFILMTFVLFLKYIECLPQDYHCQILFSNFRGLLITSLVIYFGPTIISTIIYVYIIHYTKHRTSLVTQQNRQRLNQRDLQCWS